MGSERGGIRSEGGGRELMGAGVVADRAGGRWCCLVVVGCPCCPSFGPCCRAVVVVRSLSFVRSCPSSACFASGASGITRLGRGTGTVLAVNCPWAVNGGRVKLVRKVAVEDVVLTMYSVYDDDDSSVVVVCIFIPPTSLARHL